MFYGRAKQFPVARAHFEQDSKGRPKISASLYILKYAVNFEIKTIGGVHSAFLPESIAI